MPRRRTDYHIQIQGYLIVAALALSLFFLPNARAWWRFPAMTAAQLEASLRDATRRPTFPAFDASGAEVEVASAALVSARPGPCRRWYGRANSDRRSRQQWFTLAGTATFECLHDIEAEGHGPLRMVVQTLFLTDPPARFRPEGRALTGAEARGLLER